MQHWQPSSLKDLQESSGSRALTVPQVWCGSNLRQSAVLVTPHAERGRPPVRRGDSGRTRTGQSSRGPGFGVWSKNADGTYAAKFRFYRYNPDGSLAGTNVVSTTRSLSGDTSTYTGVTRNEVRDASGAVLQTVCVTDVGTRFN